MMRQKGEMGSKYYASDFPFCQLFEIHGSFKSYPVGNLGQATEKVV